MLEKYYRQLKITPALCLYDVIKVIYVFLVEDYTCLN